MTLDIGKFIDRVNNNIGYCLIFYFGETGTNFDELYDELNLESIRLCIIIRPESFSDSCSIVGKGTIRGLMKGIEQIIADEKLDVYLETNPPSKNLDNAWYVYGTDNERILLYEKLNVIN